MLYYMLTKRQLPPLRARRETAQRRLDIVRRLLGRRCEHIDERVVILNIVLLRL